MKIPNYINAALRRREKAALALMEADDIITKFIERHNIEVEEYDYCTGIEMYTNPTSSAARVREAIENKEKR